MLLTASKVGTKYMQGNKSMWELWQIVKQTCLLLSFLHIFYAFWAPKYALRITITELRTQENPILAKFSFILMLNEMSAMTRNRMIVIESTVRD